jgi:hypothetical protein
MSLHIEWAEAPFMTERVGVVHPYEVHGADEPNYKWAFSLDTGSSGVIIEGTRLELMLLAKTMHEVAKAIKPGFSSFVNTPGYLPDDMEDVEWSADAKEAWDFLRNERMVALENADIDPDTDATFAHLRSLSEGLLWEELGDAEHPGAGVIIGTKGDWHTPVTKTHDHS